MVRPLQLIQSTGFLSIFSLIGRWLHIRTHSIHIHHQTASTLLVHVMHVGVGIESVRDRYGIGTQVGKLSSPEALMPSTR